MFSGNILRDAIISGSNNIFNERQRVDELNVFPVPDGDTGTNMSMSIGNAARELSKQEGKNAGEIAKIAGKAFGIWLAFTALGLIFSKQIAKFLKFFKHSFDFSICALVNLRPL